MKRLISFIIIILFITLLSSCKQNTYVFGKFSFYGYFDTNLDIIIEYDQKVTNYQTLYEEIHPHLEDLLSDLEFEFSGEKGKYNSSTVKKINNNSGKSSVEASNYLIDLIKICNKYSSNYSVFDISIGTLTYLWNDRTTLPTEEEILSAKSLVNYNNITITDTSVKLEIEGMMLDVGAAAKGYAVDLIKEYLDTITDGFYLINFGGNIYISDTSKCINNTELEDAVILEDPFDTSNYLMSVKVSNINISTSNSSNRYLEIDGNKYSHIINPLTGYPANTDIESITVFADKSVDADISSTICYILGLDDAVTYLNENNLQAIIITKDKKIYNIGNIQYNLLNGGDYLCQN